ncbi:hypothetical protein AB0M95_29545 [Sphaerisporangium sp. NPDC051017]|uniref:hypothetical protein n=1 Tax=Sphaerisporangium sp. NPDC051017 TaxID=3154636 RepID=UPI00343E0DB2
MARSALAWRDWLIELRDRLRLSVLPGEPLDEERRGGDPLQRAPLQDDARMSTSTACTNLG